jgi:predicted deacylase
VTVADTSDIATELAPPDLSPYRDGNIGIPYVMSFAAAAPGPHAMVLALTHGNETCGAIALDRLLRQGAKPRHGRLTFAFANIAAYDRFDPREPHLSRCVDEDLNRVWAPAILDGPRRSVELKRARELRSLIDAVDVLLDLHSMSAPSPPLALTGMRDKSVPLAHRVGMPEIIMRDAGHAEGTRLRDYGPFDDPASPAAALLVECGQHWRPETASFAFEVATAFLAATGMIATDMRASAKPQRILDVTHTVTASGDRLAFTRKFAGLDIVPRAGTVIAHDGDRLVATPYDDCVIAMPSSHASRGQTAVRLGRFRV